MLHHVELYVSDLVRSAEFWSWLLSELGYRPFQTWPKGRSWIKGETYLVLVQVEDRFREPTYHRCRVGLNHLAFHATSREQVDALTTKLRERGVKMLYEDRDPHAGGADHHAVFFEDPDRVKIEVVAPAPVPTTPDEVTIRELFSGKGAVCEQVLRALPEWFGIESSIRGYMGSVETLPTWVAEWEGRPVGFLALELKNEWVAEVHVMGVRPELHGKGIGTRLLLAADVFLHGRGVEFMTVKTLGPSRGNEGYARTRGFYLARGFRPIEEFQGVWPPGNPCLVMVRSVPEPSRGQRQPDREAGRLHLETSQDDKIQRLPITAMPGEAVAETDLQVAPPRDLRHTGAHGYASDLQQRPPPIQWGIHRDPCLHGHRQATGADTGRMERHVG